jgi:5-methylcytosine-specific restriction endonuclease McrA
LRIAKRSHCAGINVELSTAGCDFAARQFRSRSGQDAQENLITLCHSCHSTLHEEKQ